MLILKLIVVAANNSVYNPVFLMGNEALEYDRRLQEMNRQSKIVYKCHLHCYDKSKPLILINYRAIL